jgi:D-beta-D-heptose 7-phosphate kinase/D-beta-D-heptose 1-phosphate adenosyltransferase
MNKEIPDFTKVRITIVGDVMLDRYWFCNASRISPEAPVPIAHVRKTEERPGGASNVALNAKALGCQVTLFGIIGEDEPGKCLEKILQQAEIKCHWQKTANIPTIAKLRVIAHEQQLIRLDFEESLAKVDKAELIKKFTEHLKHTDIVIFSDYGKGIAEIAPKLINLVQQHNIPILIDPKGRDFNIYAGATCLTPNFTEFETIVGICEDETEIERKGLRLIEDLKIEALLITMGAHGMTLLRPDQETVNIPTHAREVYDVTGAGDTVIATLAATFAATKSFTQAMQFANVAAGISVGKLGAAVVSPFELRRSLQKHQDSSLGVMTEKQLLQEVEEAKRNHEVIVMTNGVFDILHEGHVTYLEQAKALGTRLIVAVNDDASVKRLKGSDRPINPVEQRMHVLACLRSVDWVVAFTEDTPERLIKAVTPNILVKGGDYKVNEIAGAEHVMAHGGAVKILPFVLDRSTTNIIKRTKGNNG